MKALTLLLLELLETNNDVLLGDLLPAALGNEGGADGLELAVVKDSLWGTLDVDDVAGLDEGGGGCGGEGRSVLEGLGLTAEVKHRGSHRECGMSVSVSGGVSQSQGLEEERREATEVQKKKVCSKTEHSTTQSL